MHLKIERGVPICKSLAYGKGGGRPRSEIGKTIRAMDIGDSVLLETERDADRARSAANHLKLRLVRRKTREGWRIWRVA